MGLVLRKRVQVNSNQYIRRFSSKIVTSSRSKLRVLTKVMYYFLCVKINKISPKIIKKLIPRSKKIFPLIMEILWCFYPEYTLMSILRSDTNYSWRFVRRNYQLLHTQLNCISFQVSVTKKEYLMSPGAIKVSFLISLELK